MNKAELIAAIAADINLQKVVVESVLESAGRVIAQHFAAAGHHRPEGPAGVVLRDFQIG